MVILRDMEYTYTVELPEGWRQEGKDRYSSTTPWAHLTISSQMLPDGYGVERFSQFVQDDLQKGWWPNASLFEIDSVEEGLTNNQPTRHFHYRVQESTQYCVVDVQELVGVTQILPGIPHGFRLRAWMCENDVAAHGQVRESLLESFEVNTGPAEYYRQFIVANGVTVKADGSVDPAAVEAGAEIVSAMLSGRQDIVRCMARTRADLAIIPRDQTVTTLPEYAHLAGTKDFTGRSRDTFDLRGLGGVVGQPVASAAEEQLLGTLEPKHPYYPHRGLVPVHEFAHSIQNLCFTPEDDERWNGFYQDALQLDLYPGTHMMADVDEFFAVFTTGYFEVTDELGSDNTRDILEARFQDVFQALDDIYKGAVLPEIYKAGPVPYQ